MRDRSWASVEGVIQPPTDNQVSGKYLIKLFQLEAEYVLESNEFGAIKSASIPMRGRIVHVQSMKNEDGKFVLVNRGYEIEKSYWYPDEDSSEVMQDVLCLSFATGRDGMFGLTVKETGEDSNQYERTGVFRILPENTNTAPEDWIYPDSPFVELWDMDLEDSDEDCDEFDLV